MIFIFFISLALGQEQTQFRVPLDVHGLFKSGLVAVADDGSICVADTEEKHLLFFDSKGKFKKKAGREGQGPGEFKNIRDLQWVASSSTFFVTDWSNNRLSQWKPDGSLAGEQTLSTYFETPVFISDKAGFAILQNSGLKGSQPQIVALNLEKGTMNKVWTMAPLRRPSGVHLTEPSLTVDVKFDWDPGLIFDAGSKFLAVNYNENNKVYLLDPNSGKVLRALRPKMKRAPFTDEDLDRRFAGPATAFRAKLEPHIQKPLQWPVLSMVRIDSQNRIWLFGAFPPGKKELDVIVANEMGKVLSRGKIKGLPKAMKGNALFFLSSDTNDKIYLEKRLYTLP